MDVCENFLAALGIFHTSEEWNRPRVVLTCQKIRPPIIAKSRKDESALPHPPPPPAPRDSRELRTSLGVGGCEKIRARRRVCPRHTLPARNHGRALAGRGANTAARLWLPRTYVEAGGSWVNTGQRARRRRKSGANPPREKSIVSARSRAGAALSSAQARGRLDDGSTTARRRLDDNRFEGAALATHWRSRASGGACSCGRLRVRPWARCCCSLTALGTRAPGRGSPSSALSHWAHCTAAPLLYARARAASADGAPATRRRADWRARARPARHTLGARGWRGAARRRGEAPMAAAPGRPLPRAPKEGCKRRGERELAASSPGRGESRPPRGERGEAGVSGCFSPAGAVVSWGAEVRVGGREGRRERAEERIYKTRSLGPRSAVFSPPSLARSRAGRFCLDNFSTFMHF